MFLSGIPSSSEDNLQKWITDAGLTAAQTFDFGSAQCYPGTGQKIFDLSGNGYDCFLGADGSSGTDDPTFVGTAGGLSSGEYFSFDGGDLFRYDGSNETAFNAIHKDNATFTLMVHVYMADPLAVGAFFGTAFQVTDVGFGFNYNGTNIGLTVHNGTGSLSLNKQFDTLPTAGAWNFIAVSIDEAGGASGSFAYINGAYNQLSASNTFNAAYTSPSSSAATDVLEFGARGDGNQKLPNGARLMMGAILSAAASKAQLDAIYSNISARS
jgi:hypothetical protein